MNILLCGVGALGSNIAALLACDLKGEHEITVLDKDNVEERNVQAGIQFYQKNQVGMSKVEALQYNIYKFYEREIKLPTSEEGKILSTTKIQEMSLGDLREFSLSKNKDGIMFENGLIIDCFDNFEARDYLQQEWKTQITRYTFPWNYSLLHVGFSDKHTFAIEWAENYKVPTDITSGFDICTMEGAASFVKMVSSLASQVVQEWIRTGKKRELIGNKTFDIVNWFFRRTGNIETDSR